LSAGIDPSAVKLIGLLGLAHRAGKLAIGATEVEKLVHRNRRPVVIVAQDAGVALRRRLLRLNPVRGFLTETVDRVELAHLLGRSQVAVVAVADQGFVRGILRLELPRIPPAQGLG